MVGTVRMKKKGWIRETWPRENCRDPVAHLNRKGASGERGWAGKTTKGQKPQVLQKNSSISTNVFKTNKIIRV